MANERLIPGQGDWRLYGLQHLQRYRFALDRVRALHVLDLACGVGYGSFVLSQTATSCLGADLSSEAIAYARAHYHRDNLTYLVGDAATEFVPAAGFDAVVSFETIEHLRDPRGFLARLHRALRPAGLLIVSAPNALQFSRASHPRPNEYHFSEPTHEEFTAWLDPWFLIQEEWEQSPVYPALGEGARRAGEAKERNDRLAVRRLAETPLRWLSAAETALRRRMGKELPALPTIESEASVVLSLSEIFPLLPERRGRCPQFIFVCRRRDVSA